MPFQLKSVSQSISFIDLVDVELVDGLVELGVDAVEELDDLHGTAGRAEVGEADEVTGQHGRLVVLSGWDRLAQLDVVQYRSAARCEGEVTKNESSRGEVHGTHARKRTFQIYELLSFTYHLGSN